VQLHAADITKTNIANKL